MPTENERKFVINKSCQGEIEKASVDQYKISQGYLIATRGITVRIRKLIKKSDGSKSYFFTLKVTTNGRCVEIEKPIDVRDFNDLWHIALNKLKKIRYIIINEEDIWEIDFFKDYKGEIYFAVAEIEMEENKLEPDSIPDLIKNNVILKVPLNDARFSNKLLGDARYASRLLKNINKK